MSRTRRHGRSARGDETTLATQELTSDVSSRRSLHNQKKTCASCGYPAAKIRKCTSPTSRYRAHPEGQTLTAHHSQLVREGEAQKGHRYRPHAVPQHSVEEVQERLPDRRPQGRSGRHGYPFCINGCYDGQGRGRWDGSFSASGVMGTGHFSDGPTFSLLHHKWHDFARDSVQRSKHRATGQEKRRNVWDQSHRFFLGKFRVKGRGRVSEGASATVKPAGSASSDQPESPASWRLGEPRRDSDYEGYHLYYWPRSNTLTPPSPPTWYKYSWFSVRAPPCVILTTPLTSLAAPVSSSRKLKTVSASCARLSANQACCFSSVVSCSLMSGSSAASVTMAACVF
jgi:hypothetical protein